MTQHNDNNLIKFIATTVETMRHRMDAIDARMATKDDIGRLESSLEVKTTVIRGDIEQVQIRLDSIDRGLSGRMGLIESDLSRFRSVLYLLVKDRPDMLRLLGQTAGETRA